MQQPQTALPSAVVDGLRGVPTATAKQVLATLGVRRVDMPGLTLLATAGLPLAGRARTLRYLPLREDVGGLPSGPVGRRAVEALEPGEVLVIDAMGRCDGAVLGDMMGARARYLGAAGVVADGAVRDVESLQSLGLPVFAVGTCPDPSSVALVPWEADVPVQCRGRLVRPGDVILADRDAVLAIPAALAAEVLSHAAGELAKDELSQALLARGAALDEAYPLPQSSPEELGQAPRRDER